jgi:ferrous iron transport protein B
MRLVLKVCESEVVDMSQTAAKVATVALVGNPNTGKTSLFNRLTGLRARTANYPGITVDLRKGRLKLPNVTADIIDLPGFYSLDALSPEEQVAKAALTGQLEGESSPDAVVLVLDATSLRRNLFVASEVLDLCLPTVVALNLVDAAESAKIRIDIEDLEKELGCKVVPVSAKTGKGLDELKRVLDGMLVSPLAIIPEEHFSCTAGCTGCQYSARFAWAERVANATTQTPETVGKRTEAIDRFLTHPVLGLMAFSALMLGVFYLIFSLAGVPMELIDGTFGRLGDLTSSLIPTDVPPVLWTSVVAVISMAVVSICYRLAEIKRTPKSMALAVAVSAWVAWLPVDDFESLLVDGVIGGIGGILIFLPQICILFFLISLLEDSGYMARAAFVMERLMRFVGLPGKAFVPMLSAHACAIPGIMAARVIESWRDRLVTILVLPFLTCSARLPVYAMVTALLFSDSPTKAALAFVGAYMLGIGAALSSAWCLKKTLLKGEAVPLVIELPAYRMPSLWNALMIVTERAIIFVRQAGTVILLISVILWALATYPKMPESALSVKAAGKVAALRAEAENSETPDELIAQADHLVASEGLAYSFAGRAGRLVEPVFRPLGFDWKINVGIITSFAAREVVVSTLAIVYGIGEDGAEDEKTLVETLRRQKRPDGTPVFDVATGLSLLVFFVLAMQCLPTQAVTKRETGSWRWAVFQLVYMTGVAYVAAAATYQLVSRLAV